MSTPAPATPSPFGGTPYDTPPELLEWTAPTWYEPTLPVPRSVTPTGATVLIPIISMVPVHKGPGVYVRAFDSMPDQGYPLLQPTNPPLPLDVLGAGLAPPPSPAPGETPWTKFPQYAPELRPVRTRTHAHAQ